MVNDFDLNGHCSFHDSFDVFVRRPEGIMGCLCECCCVLQGVGKVGWLSKDRSSSEAKHNYFLVNFTKLFIR